MASSWGISLAKQEKKIGYEVNKLARPSQKVPLRLD
jgi:hypothetical protein